MTGKLLLTFNAGSSTVKIGLFLREDGKARRIGKGMIDFRHKPLTFHLVEGPETFDVPLEAGGGDVLHDVLDETFDWFGRHFAMDAVTAVGHRVVHGGDSFRGPVLLDAPTIEAIDALSPLAPLHQPQNVRLIRAVADLRPGVPQTASFDTAFHAGQAPVVRRFAIPRSFYEDGIKRYGFHGLSYAFVSAELARRRPDVAGARTVIAHLGSGASLCAVSDGKSRDSSMSFSTIDGIPMATRSGAIDPGVLFHLMRTKGMNREEVEDLLYHKSGLLGLSGISADSRVLLESDRPEAREALDVFTFRIAGEVARLSASIGGLDALVFTAGIGEHQPAIRHAVCDRLAFLGIALDDEANAANAEMVSAPESRTKVFVIATDEEQVIADEALAVLAGRQTSPELS